MDMDMVNMDMDMDIDIDIDMDMDMVRIWIWILDIGLHRNSLLNGFQLNRCNLKLENQTSNPFGFRHPIHFPGNMIT